jgi:hypothetical protein
MLDWNLHIVTGGDNSLKKNGYDNASSKEELNIYFSPQRKYFSSSNYN